MKSNGQKYRWPLNAIIGARALPHRHLICTGTGGIVSTWLQLLNSRSDYPATITTTPHLPQGPHQGNQNMSNQHTGMCITPFLPRPAYFNPSTNVQLAHVNHSEGTEEGATMVFSFMHQQPGFKIEAQIFLEIKNTISAANPRLSKEARSFFNSTRQKKASKGRMYDCEILLNYTLYKRKACDPQQKNSRLSQLTFNGAVQHM